MIDIKVSLRVELSGVQGIFGKVSRARTMPYFVATDDYAKSVNKEFSRGPIFRTRGPICHKKITRSPICRCPICLEQIYRSIILNCFVGFSNIAALFVQVWNEKKKYLGFT